MFSSSFFAASGKFTFSAGEGKRRERAPALHISNAKHQILTKRVHNVRSQRASANKARKLRHNKSTTRLGGALIFR